MSAIARLGNMITPNSKIAASLEGRPVRNPGEVPGRNDSRVWLEPPADQGAPGTRVQKMLAPRSNAPPAPVASVLQADNGFVRYEQLAGKSVQPGR